MPAGYRPTLIEWRLEATPRRAEAPDAPLSARALESAAAEAPREEAFEEAAGKAEAKRNPYECHYAASEESHSDPPACRLASWNVEGKSDIGEIGTLLVWPWLCLSLQEVRGRIATGGHIIARAEERRDTGSAVLAV